MSTPMTSPPVPVRLRREKRIHARTAAEVNDPFAGRDCGQPEVITHARERLDRFRRYGIWFAGGQAEPLGQNLAHLEMEPALRCIGDRTV